MNIQRLFRAAKNSVDGLKVLWVEEAFRLEVIILLIALPVIFFLPVTGSLKLLLLLLLILLLVVEAINSAIEAIIDRISLDYHPQSRKAKDIGSAAVLLVLIMNVIAWIYVIC